MHFLSRFSVSLSSVLFVLFLTAAALAENGSTPTPSSPPDLSKPHNFSVHDMVRMQRVGEPVPSPDGQHIVFTVRQWDAEANQATTRLWLMAADGSQLRELTNSKGHADSSPTWSADSRTVAFVSNRSGSQQVWTIAISGGEAMQFTTLPVDCDNVRWSPDGSHIAFSAEVYPDADMKETARRDKARAENSVKALKFDRLFIRHWDTWFDGKRSHIFTLPVKRNDHGAWQTAGEPVDLMKGVEADCPVKPFGGREEFAWSPDGGEIAYTAQLGRDVAWSTDLNIYLAPVSGGAVKAITADNKATDTGPVYSPDGKMIAFRAMARPGFESDRYRIKLYDRASGSIRAVAENWDRSPSSLEWSADSKTLFCTASEGARQKVFAVDVADSQPGAIVGHRFNSGVALLQQPGKPSSARLVYAQDSLTSPAEIWTANTDGSEEKQLTHLTDAAMRLVRVSQPNEFFFLGAQGEGVHAWILKPVGFEEGKKYPVAFVIHGGPQGAIEDHFHYRWNLQAFAGAGYAVIAVNFHGSTGFGQAFTDSITGDWGGKPFEDLMKGLDHALANYKWLDGSRVAGLGASYGGWMINWINGHTNRFKCLVNHDGGFDEFANYFTTEELWFPEWEFKGVPWERPELYDKFAPSRYVAKWQTPTLVIHGAKDYRVIDAEGIATFTALQRRGIPSELLYFPDENHWVLKPQNSIVWHDAILAWLERWLKEREK
jgi:dipeptidyl aminopeptidase/acylaminoacyl peptidase